MGLVVNSSIETDPPQLNVATVPPVCCGIDVHKRMLAVCVIQNGPQGEIRHKRQFGTTTEDLEELMGWLAELEVTHVAMESTGPYWRPVWNVLVDGPAELMLINAEHYRALRGKKTDMKDGERIAEFLRHGLLEGSFVPNPELQALRELTRYRTRLTQQKATASNRIQKVLETANIKLASVASDVLGLSGRLMLKAIAKGESDPEKLANLAKGKLVAKMAELRRALNGRVRDYQRLLLEELLDELEHVEDKISRLDAEIETRMKPYAETVRRWRTIPGIDRVTAWILVAEIGPDMQQFGTPGRLSSWAGVCPGNNESGGKRMSGRIRKGNAWLKRALCQAAWAAARKKDSYLKGQFYRLAPKRGKKRAIIAVAHTILVTGFWMLSRGEDYRDLGISYFDRLHPEALKQKLVKRLEGLGLKVTIEAATPAA